MNLTFNIIKINLNTTQFLRRRESWAVITPAGECVMFKPMLVFPPASYGSQVNSPRAGAQKHTHTHTCMHAHARATKSFSLNIEEQYVTVSSSYSRVVQNHLQPVTLDGKKWAVSQTFLLYDRGVRRVSSQLMLTACALVQC
jgi:hypothetical protein